MVRKGDAMAKQKKQCESCNMEPAVTSERFCKKCRKARLALLEAEGYLDKVPRSCSTFSEELGRKRTVDLNSLGGTAEMNSDGDDW